MIEEAVRVDKYGIEEPFEKTLRRFKKKVEEELIFENIKNHEFFKKPSKVRRERLNKRGNTNDLVYL